MFGGMGMMGMPMPAMGMPLGGMMGGMGMGMMPGMMGGMGMGMPGMGMGMMNPMMTGMPGMSTPCLRFLSRFLTCGVRHGGGAGISSWALSGAKAASALFD